MLEWVAARWWVGWLVAEAACVGWALLTMRLRGPIRWRRDWPWVVFGMLVWPWVVWAMIAAIRGGWVEREW